MEHYKIKPVKDQIIQLLVQGTTKLLKLSDDDRNDQKIQMALKHRQLKIQI